MFGLALSNDILSGKYKKDSLSHLLRKSLENKKGEGGFSKFFADELSVEVLSDDFATLKYYMEECFACISEQKYLASAILLRCCVEALCNEILKDEITEDEKRKLFTLEAKITHMTNQENIEKKEKLSEIFAYFKKHKREKELYEFLYEIKEIGNDTAHINKEKIEKLLETADFIEYFKLFCLLLEFSLLKAGRGKIRNKKEDARFSAINWGKKQIKNSSENVLEKSDISDDEIPF